MLGIFIILLLISMLLNMIFYVAIKFRSKGLRATTPIAYIVTPFLVLVASIKTCWQMAGDLHKDWSQIRKVLYALVRGYLYFKIGASVMASMLYEYNKQKQESNITFLDANPNKKVSEEIIDKEAKKVTSWLSKNRRYGFGL